MRINVWHKMNCVQQHVNLQMWNSVYLSIFTVQAGGREVYWLSLIHVILKCTYGRTLKITNMSLHIFLCKYLYISDIVLIELLITVVHFFSYKFSDWAEFPLSYIGSYSSSCSGFTLDFRLLFISCVFHLFPSLNYFDFVPKFCI